jgi:hypothetical protein
MMIVSMINSRETIGNFFKRRFIYILSYKSCGLLRVTTYSDTAESGVCVEGNYWL